MRIEVDITQTDIKNYRKFGDFMKGSAVFANALAERLRQKFPQRKFEAAHYESEDRESGTYSMESYVKEITGRKFKILKKKRDLAYIWAGHIPSDCRNGISIQPTDLREIIEEETIRLNGISGAGKEIFYD